MTKDRNNYNPTPVYNRKYAREVIRAQIINTHGYHDVSGIMSERFKTMRKHFTEGDKS